MSKANRENQVGRAPNGKFYAIWRKEPVCALGGVLFYFETERDTWDFLAQCDAENRLVEFP